MTRPGSALQVLYGIPSANQVQVSGSQCSKLVRSLLHSFLLRTFKQVAHLHLFVIQIEKTGTWSGNRATVALASAEAFFLQKNKKGLKDLTLDDMKILFHRHASAALSVLEREGVGRKRRIITNVL